VPDQDVRKSKIARRNNSLFGYNKALQPRAGRTRNPVTNSSDCSSESDNEPILSDSECEQYMQSASFMKESDSEVEEMLENQNESIVEIISSLTPSTKEDEPSEKQIPKPSAGPTTPEDEFELVQQQERLNQGRTRNITHFFFSFIVVITQLSMILWSTYSKRFYGTDVILARFTLLSWWVVICITLFVSSFLIAIVEYVVYSKIRKDEYMYSSEDGSQAPVREYSLSEDEITQDNSRESLKADDVDYYYYSDESSVYDGK